MVNQQRFWRKKYVLWKMQIRIMITITYLFYFNPSKYIQLPWLRWERLTDRQLERQTVLQDIPNISCLFTIWAFKLFKQHIFNSGFFVAIKNIVMRFNIPLFRPIWSSRSRGQSILKRFTFYVRITYFDTTVNIDISLTY